MKLDENEVSPDPIQQFVLWFEQAIEAGIPEPNAMALATADKNAMPSVRIVLLKEIDEKGFVFFTNYQSKKGSNLYENPNASIMFFWIELQRQIRIDGKVDKLSIDKSDAYFAQRPRESQISARISPQSRVVPGREFLDGLFAEAEKEFYGQPIPRPNDWGGFCLIPETIEFWQGRTGRLHDRIFYKKVSGIWSINRLAP